MKEVILNNILELAFSVISLIVSGVMLPLFSDWVKSKIHNQKLVSAITDIERTVASCVECAEQTIVASLKSTDVWDKAAQQSVFEDVCSNVKDALLSSTLKFLEDNDVDTDGMIETHIESYLQNRKSK